MSESAPRYDHAFIVKVQSDDAVPADILSQLITAFNNAELPVYVEYFGTIDYEEQGGSQDV